MKPLGYVVVQYDGDGDPDIDSAVLHERVEDARDEADTARAELLNLGRNNPVAVAVVLPLDAA